MLTPERQLVVLPPMRESTYDTTSVDNLFALRPLVLERR
jgi:hypothetical protein